MATSTTNFNLQKPAYNDPADINVLNGNSDIIDTTLQATDQSIAIVAKGNTHEAIPSGQYVYVHGHSTLSEGLYTNSTSSTISQNATLSTSNLTAVSEGGLNSLYSKITAAITTVREQLSSFAISETSLSNLQTSLSTQISNMSNNQIRIGRITGNYSGDEITRGATCVAVLYRQNSTTYHCFVLGTWKWGYYYSNAWHWT